ncbi:nucleotide-binding universal stress UspA family protein [Flavobacterium sp. CG_9.1]|uniref:Nucleotide-binding universal stress protein, UspA family n=1 Tax=Flavobacterium xanthum TaxID=69322 RepID=A0A1M7J4I0_9FLAO|nr:MULTISPECIES: universal stress protein [Flavobacterium]MBG6062041.1 nucleotide-binding universal stress UspA family protein [Flavobacterium sp. CG_9.1]SHM47989.1 Nucleotide-binding universal stress protein, UspA family [Flavobacterium xanthum]
MKKILFPTDFSEVAANAFIHALEFAKIVHGEIVLLHTFELPIYDNQFFPENYALIYNSVELAQFGMFKDEIPKLRALAEERHLDKIKMTHRLMDGDLLHNIKKSIKEDAIDFVIMGTSGVTGWDAFFVGSNAGSVISGIEIPMLCIPIEAKFKKIEIIGFTTRFRTKDKKALKMVLDIAKKTKAKVKCLYVKTSESDVSKDTVAHWEEEFINEPVEFFVISSDEVKETILDFILYKEIDILTMLTYKRGFFEGIFKPSLTKKIANNFDIPILAIHMD